MKRSRDDGPGSSAVVKRCARETRSLELERARGVVVGPLSTSLVVANGRSDRRARQTRGETDGEEIARAIVGSSRRRVSDRPTVCPDGDGTGAKERDGDRWIDGSIVRGGAMWERDVWNVDDSGDATRCDGRETVG